MRPAASASDDAAYVAERERAQARAIYESMDRRMGRARSGAEMINPDRPQHVTNVYDPLDW